MIRNDLRAALEEMPIVDGHEHWAWSIAEYPDGQGYPLDPPFLLAHTYLIGDIKAAGADPEMENPQRDSRPKGDPAEAERLWQKVAPWLDEVRSCAYYRYMLIAFRELHGLQEPDIAEENWRALLPGMVERTRDNVAWVKSLLDRMKVHRVILDITGPGMGVENAPLMNDERLTQAVRFEQFIHAEGGLAELLHEGDYPSFAGFLQSFDDAFARAVQDGAVAVKTGLAYHRTLQFDDVPREDAEGIFHAGVLQAPPAEQKAFQDFMVHRMCALCGIHGVPLQIHTGLQAQNFHTLTDSKPTHLTSLFQKYPQVRFDLFHGGYPYYEEAGLMAKYFPNVWIDGCWFTHFAPTAYKQALDTWIEMVPANKIFAWGGDHRVADLTYASLVQAKDLIADVLAAKVESGYFDQRLALSLARKILHDNLCDFYHF